MDLEKKVKIKKEAADLLHTPQNRCISPSHRCRTPDFNLYPSLSSKSQRNQPNIRVYEDPDAKSRHQTIHNHGNSEGPYHHRLLNRRHLLRKRASSPCLSNRKQPLQTSTGNPSKTELHHQASLPNIDRRLTPEPYQKPSKPTSTSIALAKRMVYKTLSPQKAPPKDVDPLKKDSEAIENSPQHDPLKLIDSETESSANTNKMTNNKSAGEVLPHLRDMSKPKTDRIVPLFEAEVSALSRKHSEVERECTKLGKCIEVLTLQLQMRKRAKAVITPGLPLTRTPNELHDASCQTDMEGNATENSVDKVSVSHLVRRLSSLSPNISLFTIRQVMTRGHLRSSDLIAKSIATPAPDLDPHSRVATMTAVNIFPRQQAI